MHLPVFAAAAGGLFAERDLDVELLDDRGSTTERIASGDAEFGLTAVVYYLRAQAAHRQPLAARVVMAFHQRDPIAGVVRDDSAIRTPADLAGARAARWQLSWMVPAYAAALERLGLDPPQIVDVEGDPSAALRDDTVDVVPTWADTIPVRSYGGVTVRAVPVGGEAYASGLVAADRVDDDVVARVREAIGAGFALQRQQPDIGVAAFQDHYPDIPAADVRDNWDLFVPYALPGSPRQPGALDLTRWRATVAHVTSAHALPAWDADAGYRQPQPARWRAGPRQSVPDL